MAASETFLIIPSILLIYFGYIIWKEKNSTRESMPQGRLSECFLWVKGGFL
jgi:hypothetical protein